MGMRGRPRKSPAIIGRGLALMEQGLSPEAAADELAAEGMPINNKSLRRAAARLAVVEPLTLGDDDPWKALREIVTALVPEFLPAIEAGLRAYTKDGAQGLQAWLQANGGPVPEFSAEQRRAILDSVETLLAPVRAAQAQGISEAEWQALLRADPALQRELARREAMGEQRLVAAIAKGEEVSTYLRVLANRWPERYAR